MVEVSARPAGVEPEGEAVSAESVGLAMLVVLDTLTPPERLAFVLHDSSPCRSRRSAPSSDARRATRKLASGPAASRGTPVTPDAPSPATARSSTRSSLPSSDGDFAGLLAVLDPDVVFRSDEFAATHGGLPVEVHGAHAVAEQYVGRAVLARSALVDGRVGVVVAPLGHLVVVLAVTINAGRITAIDAVADPGPPGPPRSRRGLTRITSTRPTVSSDDDRGSGTCRTSGTAWRS